MDRFDDKVVVITGGATGIGLALGKALGGEGARIVIGEPRAHRLAEAVSELSFLGIDARQTVCDVRDPASVDALADFAWSEHGRVDVLINNAGISQPSTRLIDTPLATARDVMETNFFGVWHGCAVFGRRMIDQGTPAAIYNVASENALFTAVPRIATYVASKHAVLGLSEAFREEVPDFIEVATIFPGFVSTELIDPAFAPRGMDADRFAEIVLEQMKAGVRFIVSHAHNAARVAPRYEALQQAFETYAPRYEGDEEYDVRHLIAALRRASRQAE